MDINEVITILQEHFPEGEPNDLANLAEEIVASAPGMTAQELIQALPQVIQKLEGGVPDSDARLQALEGMRRE
jgi:endonuclease III